MFNAGPFQPACWEEIEAALADAIRSSAGNRMTRNAELFVAGICAKHLTDKLVLAGFVFMRRVSAVESDPSNTKQALIALSPLLDPSSTINHLAGRH